MLNLRKVLHATSRMPLPVFFIVAGSFFVSVARAMSLTFVAIILYQDFGMSSAVIGIVLGSGPLLGAISAPVVGGYSDAIGRKQVLAIILGMLSISVAVMGTVSNPLLYCVAYTIAATSISLFVPISRAIISDGSHERDRLKYFSWRYTASNLGWAIGPIISIAIGSSKPAGFLIAGAILAALFLILTALDIPSPQPVSDKPYGLSQTLPAIVSAFRDKRLLCFMFGGMLALSVYSHWSATMGPYLLLATTDGPRTFAILVSTNGVVVLLVNPIARRLIARVGGFKGLIAGCAMLSASQIGFDTSTSLPALVTSMVALSIGEVLVVCAEFVLVDTLASDANRGSYFGAHAISSTGNFLGPVVGGFSLAVFGGASMFLMFALVAVISAAVFFVGIRASPPTGKQ